MKHSMIKTIVSSAVLSIALGVSAMNTQAYTYGTASSTAPNVSQLSVKAKNQDVSGGTITAKKIVADANGWMVVHRTDGKKPGPVVAHAPLKAGTNKNVTGILTEKVKKGEKLMVMLHSEASGKSTGIFEYTLGAKEDGPIKVDGKLVMQIIEAI